jgi:pimeloyl-ACP methyl ester carboxylesterase
MEMGARMARADVRGVGINYEAVGDEGPWVVVTEGGRSDLEVARPMAERFASAGFRAVIHDRRNCGASDVSLSGDGAEDELFADDVYELLLQLDALPAYVCGGSSGSRMSMVLTVRHPDAVRALMLWSPSGRRFAAERLAENYYGQYILVAEQGGMAAVCDTPYYRQRIERHPANREHLMGLDVDEFISTMRRWRQYILDGGELPMIGVTEAELRSIAVPTCIIPGEDDVHPYAVAEDLVGLIPNAELHPLEGLPFIDTSDPAAAMRAYFDRQGRYAEVFFPFLEGIGAPAAS